MSLNKVEKGKYYKIKSVPDMDILKSLGVRENDTVFKKHTYIWGGPTLLEIDSREIAISNAIASSISVEESEVA
ncbi:FeoA family protein [Alkalibacter saccharofermentans]|uniref:Fe2+ transport system protein FeoA n=1 Tax=Alkalibacter saccharofermentans DSM 14828 TaxID=1120975 RepID=A0A1M4VYZ9_9FIRM|nr:FeoA family protein [Alkalibacter saccharofermentans]SHE74208.1 Fe2+ transport system protein FeoA [Alkalibacter saccharofermentans DSM 14828]